MKRAWLLGLLWLAACDRNSGKSGTSIDAVPASVSFDGADYQTASQKAAHGERLTYTLGCRGCHGKDLKGQLWDDNPKEYGVLWASNLTRAVPTMSDAQLTAVLAKGVHPRRQDLWVMPSELFQHLSQADMGALVAYLRTLQPEGLLSPDPRPGPKALAQIASGDAKPAATLVRERRDIGPIDLGPKHALGRYITRVTCAECHGAELKGQKSEEGATPDLVVAGGYTRAEFDRLITQGIPTGNRKLHELMQSVAKNRFSHLTDPERDALYSYLKARSEQPQ